MHFHMLFTLKHRVLLHVRVFKSTINIYERRRGTYFADNRKFDEVSAISHTYVYKLFWSCARVQRYLALS